MIEAVSTRQASTRLGEIRAYTAIRSAVYPRLWVVGSHLLGGLRPWNLAKRENDAALGWIERRAHWLKRTIAIQAPISRSRNPENWRNNMEEREVEQFVLLFKGDKMIIQGYS